MPKTLEQITPILERIANETLNINTLKTQMWDSLDFHDVSVFQLKIALAKAYTEGYLEAYHEKTS